ncbi:MAG: ATP-binding cassette domain-containing protein [Rubrobacteraceae bacterium]|nr:ATP-binding cassette domain-containing protein [Rubrobacteraceae bacterium]MCL6438096.1 ATP-binding cassette domain-containing protein [Rubrobacteraceae bacterium]
MSCRYPGSSRAAVSGLDFSVYEGEYVGVAGPNGGGKSTLVKLLNGLLVACEGEVRVAGFDPAAEPHEVRRRVSVVFQNPESNIIAPSVEDDVAFGLENLGVERGEMRRRVVAALSSVGLAGYERREPHTLSGGEKQRVALAGALAMETEVLALDEPTSMLDPAGRREVLEVIRALKRRRTIVHVSHDLSDLLTADRILMVRDGRLLADLPPSRLLADGRLLEEAGLVLPVAARLAAGLGLGVCTGPEELARAVLKRLGVQTR